MPVVTLSPALLADACRQLSDRIHTAGVEPSLIIGILTGGAEVARLMRADFPQSRYCEVRLSRPDTRQKGQGLTHRLLQRLPLWLCDWLRIAESRIREWRSHSVAPQRLGTLALPPDIDAWLQEASRNTTQPPVVLLIDDAIDTGATILRAREQLLQRYEGLTVQVAVLTVTTAHPACEAQFYLYHNRTLCRFPWSNDYK